MPETEKEAKARDAAYWENQKVRAPENACLVPAQLQEGPRPHACPPRSPMQSANARLCASTRGLFFRGLTPPPQAVADRLEPCKDSFPKLLQYVQNTADPLYAASPFLASPLRGALFS